ncbi:hypothetical protein ACFVRD_46700 [Streptomyces sp. NPDC057908]|uniref:hypothetical protein n=1 Tax=unclassified Streptomyces TaxID=2593676 RepID=UPI002E1662DE|nr:hypothetical protein OG609_45840 [Streptomyces sp. NBC_01224]
MPENQVVRARKALHLVDQLMAEQPPRGRLAVPVDVVEDDLVVLWCARVSRTAWRASSNSGCP